MAWKPLKVLFPVCVKKRMSLILILLGDCAAEPIGDFHTYFIDEFTETGFNPPTFIVAGNHDVSQGEFNYSEFEKLYGAANFSFIYRENLFIGLGVGFTTRKRPAKHCCT